MHKHDKFGTGAFFALALVALIGCSTTSTPADDGGLKVAVQAGPKLANAAAQAQRVELAKPAPSKPMLSDLTEVIIASTQTAGVKESEFIQKLITKAVSLKEALVAAEKAKEDGETALLAAQTRVGELESQLASANRRPLYWVAAIVGGVLILAGAVVIAGGAQLGIPSASLKGGSLVAVGAFALGIMVVVDRIADKAGTLVLVAGGGLTLLLLGALGYLFWRWVVQGKTLAAAVTETDKLLAQVDGQAAEAFRASAGRVMDKANKEVVALARAAATTGKRVAEVIGA